MVLFKINNTSKCKSTFLTTSWSMTAYKQRKYLGKLSK